MPVHEVLENGRVVGWRWGKTGKVYKSKAKAEEQARAIYASGWRDASPVGNFHLPKAHLFGMPVPVGGSACSKCRFVSADAKHCGNEFFRGWRKSLDVKDPSELPAPANRYCCDVFEPASAARADAVARTRARQHAHALRPNRLAELRYKKHVVAVLRGVHEGIMQVVDREILPGQVVRHDAPGDNRDGIPDRAKRVLTPRLREKVAKHVRGKVADAYDDMAQGVDKKHKRAMTLIGIPLHEAAANVAGEVATMREDNIRLIEDTGRDFLDDVRNTLTDPENEGLRVEALRGKLKKVEGMSLTRAGLIAVDQTLKLSGGLNRIRQVAAGVQEYRWSTSRDERVRGNPDGLYPKADPSHYALEGQVFRWDDPPEADVDGGPAHPGESINCRCVAIPIIEELDDSPDAASIDDDELEAAE